MSETQQKSLFVGVEPPLRQQKRGNAKSVLKGKVRVHDPFELIRWLALSQPDPRKALAELVQNSLDAGARQVLVSRVRLRQVPSLRILDNGEGVIPELDRQEALRYIATNIGHSRKRALSPQERYELMTQGQYGIGLLGFWSLGSRLEMRTAVPGQPPHRLILHRNRPEYLIEPLRGRLPEGDRWTEIVVSDLLPDARRVLAGRRPADYLAGELRGQLLCRDVDLVVEDRMARGRAKRIFPVKPIRYLGDRLQGLDEVEAPGYPPLRLELYLTDEETRGAIAVYAAGTMVCERFSDLGALGLDRLPWIDDRLTGQVDFPALNVAPGSRRGILPDAAAEALVAALAEVETEIELVLERLEERRREELDRKLVRDLRRAFRGLFRKDSRYTLLPVVDERGRALPAFLDPGGEALVGLAEASEPGESAESLEPAEAPAPPDAVASAPGPLSAVEIQPSKIRVECDTARRVRARAVDADGRPVRERVDFLFRLQGDIATLTQDPAGSSTILLRAGPRPGEDVLSVVVASADREAALKVPVEVVEAEEGRGGDEGIPEPDLVEHPGALWRSRVTEGRWQVNTAHPEYRAVRDRPILKVRYLALLFAKEVVLRSSQDPRLEQPLEQLVEVASYADRNLSKPKR